MTEDEYQQIHAAYKKQLLSEWWKLKASDIPPIVVLFVVNLTLCLVSGDSIGTAIFVTVVLSSLGVSIGHILAYFIVKMFG